MATKSAGRTDKAPAPFQSAPYSQAIRCGDFVFVSGQLPLSPGGEVVGTTIEEQTEQVFRNLRAILEAAGSGLHKIVKTTVFLVDFADFAAMNEVYRKHVGDVPPALDGGGQGLRAGRPHRDRGDRQRLRRSDEPS